MRTTVANRLSYYRNTVADTGGMNPDIATLRKENLLLLFSREEAMSGVPEDAGAAKAFLERSLKTPKEGASGGGDDGRVAGVLCPWIYTPGSSTAPRRRALPSPFSAFRRFSPPKDAFFRPASLPGFPEPSCNR